MRRLFAIAAILLLSSMLVLPHVITAQATTVEEDTFWADLQTTADLLQQAASASNPSSTLSPARTMWQNIQSVHISDGSLVHVDLTWLRNGLASNNPTQLTSLRETIDAMLNYHTTHLGESGRGSLDALNQILKDPRYHYISTPTPAPSQGGQNNQSEGLLVVSASVAQAILFIVGLIVVGVLGFNFIRQLNVQRSAVVEQAPEDDPTTSEEARDRATGSEATQDYRTAIRYLYLASLLLLDERGVIHYDRTLTNREHLRQVSNNVELSDALRPVVNTFDRVWYGFAAVNDAMYEQFRQDVERLRNIAP